MKAAIALVTLIGFLVGCGRHETPVGAWGSKNGPAFALFPDGTAEFRGYIKPATWTLDGSQLRIQGGRLAGGRISFREDGEVMTIASDWGLDEYSRYELPPKGKWAAERAAELREEETRQQEREAAAGMSE